MRSNLITAGTQVATDKTVLRGISLMAGADIATLIVYNEADSSATAAQRVASLSVAANTSNDLMFGDEGLILNAGCYVAVTGTTPVGFVYIK